MHSYHHSFIKIYSGDTDPQPTCKQHVMLCSCQLSWGFNLGSIRAGSVPPFTEAGTLPVEFLLHSWIKGRSACKSSAHQKILMQFPKPEQCSRWKKPVRKKYISFRKSFGKFFFHKIMRIFFPIPVLPQILQKLEKMTDSVLPLPVMFFLSHGILFFIFFFTTAKTNESN